MALSGNITSNIIDFNNGELNQCHEIVDKNVTVNCSLGNHDHGSSRVKLINIVDYKWEVKQYPGHIISVHKDGIILAYVIKVTNKMAVAEGMVRIQHISTGQRALIKGMTGEILDLQFAHIDNEYILACVEENVLHVHKIDVKSDKLYLTRLLRIEDRISKRNPKYDKVSWCPYIPDENSEEEEVSQMLVWARERRFQLFNISIIISSYGIGEFQIEDLKDGYLKSLDQNSLVTWVDLSPDGTTLGVGSEDGYIRFYQVYIHEKEPRCLHQWKPHAGKSISSFFFLDNLTKLSVDPYWKYAITSCDNNKEIKLWDCCSWECLQTIKLKLPECKDMGFVAEIDRSASYLVLSSIKSRNLYVLQIINESVNERKDYERKNTGTDKTQDVKSKGNVLIKSIAEFPLTWPALSFSIVDAAVRKHKCTYSNSYLLDEMDDCDEETNSVFCVVVRMFIIQPKSVKECHILYQPTVSEATDVKSSISSDSVENYKNSLGDLSVSPIKSNNSHENLSMKEESPNLSEKSRSLSPIKKVSSAEKLNKRSNLSPKLSSTSIHENFSQVNLMTPEAFSSSGKKSPECVSSEVLSTILMLASVTGSTAPSNKTTENINLLNLVNNKIIEDQEQAKVKQAIASQKVAELTDSLMSCEISASGSSSPSREVEEILSLQEYKSINILNAAESITKLNEENSRDNKKDIPINILHKNSMNTSNKTVEKIKSSTKLGWPPVPDVESFVTKHNFSDSSFIYNDINKKIDELIEIVKKQSCQITELQTEIRCLKTTSATDFSNTLKDQAYKIEMKLSKLLEQYLIRYEKEHGKKLEQFVAKRDTQNKEMKESFSKLISNYSNHVTEKSYFALDSEVQRRLLPLFIQKQKELSMQIRNEISEKLSIINNTIKDNIAEVCKSKGIIDAFGNSVVLGVQNGLQATYIESMTKTLIPAYEKSSQEMFKQLHDSFSIGIKDVMEQFENYLSQLQPVQDGTDDIIDKIADLQKQIDDLFVKQHHSIIDSIPEIKKEIKCMEINLNKSLGEFVQQEIKKSFESQTATLEDSVFSVVRSQAHTPAPSLYDIQDQIKHLLSQGMVNKAFHQALLANDLNLVEYVLEKADYKSVFDPCALEQTVLLSLIQQISADMSKHNDIKQRYLSDGILNLNQNDLITREHAPKVMKELYKNCQGFINKNPKSPLCSNVRMIMMAVQGMGYKAF